MKRFLCGWVALGLLVGGVGQVRADLLVASFYSGQVLRYDDTTGAFLGVFATAPFPAPMTIGPDQNLYVGAFRNDQVQRYDGQTGAFINTFISRGLRDVSAIAFGPDGNFYVLSFGDANHNSYITRHNGMTGAFIDNFVPPGTGGLRVAQGMVFGRDGDLYVTNTVDNQILRYDGLTGAFGGVFARSIGNNYPIALAFGPDGNLYVLDNPTASRPEILKVERFNGWTGEFMDLFVDSFRGGSDGDLSFGADGNLYVTTGEVGNSVMRFNGSTGQLLGEFVHSGSGGLNGAQGLLFVAPIPEPATLLLLAIGTVGFIGWAWRIAASHGR